MRNDSNVCLQVYFRRSGAREGLKQLPEAHRDMVEALGMASGTEAKRFAKECKRLVCER